MMKEWLTVAEVVEATGISKASIRQYLAHGKIKGKKWLGTRWLIQSTEVQRLIDGEIDISGTYARINH